MQLCVWWAIRRLSKINLWGLKRWVKMDPQIYHFLFNFFRPLILCFKCRLGSHFLRLIEFYHIQLKNFNFPLWVPRNPPRTMFPILNCQLWDFLTGPTRSKFKLLTVGNLWNLLANTYVFLFFGFASHALRLYRYTKKHFAKIPKKCKIFNFDNFFQKNYSCSTVFFPQIW